MVRFYLASQRSQPQFKLPGYRNRTVSSTVLLRLRTATKEVRIPAVNICNSDDWLVLCGNLIALGLRNCYLNWWHIVRVQANGPGLCGTCRTTEAEYCQQIMFLTLPC